MNYKKPPKVFHAKDEIKTKQSVIFPLELFSAINNICTYNEQKVLLTMLGCKGDGSFSPSTQYMLNITGIPQPNHYFDVRKKLINKGYLEEENGSIRVAIDCIMQDANNMKGGS